MWGEREAHHIQGQAIDDEMVLYLSGRRCFILSTHFDRWCDTSVSLRRKVFYFIHSCCPQYVDTSDHHDTCSRSQEIVSVSTGRTGSVVPGTGRWKSSEILQEDKTIPGGYKELGIEPNATDYHNISCLFEGHVVWLVVHRGVAFIMGSPNNTDKSDDWLFTHLESVVNHIDSQCSGNYGKWHM